MVMEANTVEQKMAIQKPLSEGIKRVKDIFEAHLRVPKGLADELMPVTKTVVGITQENFRWKRRYVKDQANPESTDGEIYSIKFQDGAVSYFMYSKVPVDGWAAIMQDAAAVSAGVRVHDWAVNDAALWDGNSRLQLIIPTGEGYGVNRYTATFDGNKTTFEASDGTETKTQTYEGDQSKPETLLKEWRNRVMRKDGSRLETVEYGIAPASK